ncbi:MAG TPA: hypothetical protein PKH07_09090, partial [bacterium]|nr:hypothetical protein [bacterium]
YHMPETNHFIIPALSSLPAASEKVQGAAEGPAKVWRIYLLSLCALVLPIALWRLIVAYQKERNRTKTVFSG